MMMHSPAEAGIALLVIGLVLMAVEAHIPSFGALGATGILAFIAGALIMYDQDTGAILGLDPGIFAGVAIFGVIFIALIALVTTRVYRKKIETGAEGLIGSVANVVEWSGKRGRIHVQGEIWRAESESNLDLKEDDKVIITKLKDLTLTIRAE